MEPFTRLTAVAAPIELDNVDTDKIVPARFLRKPRSAGYGNFLFRDIRTDAEGKEKPDFVLNQAPFRGARILIAGVNFGCGSSRAGAVYAIADYGIRVVIAASFGDIFYDSCIQHGVLPLVLPVSDCAAIRRQLHQSPGQTITVDLERQELIAPDGIIHQFSIDPIHKERLLKGLDDIALILKNIKTIEVFEESYYRDTPWLA